MKILTSCILVLIVAVTLAGQTGPHRKIFSSVHTFTYSDFSTSGTIPNASPACTFVGTTTTCLVSSTAGMSTGQDVIVLGVSQTAMKGVFPLTAIVTNTSFSYTTASTPAGNGNCSGGSCSWRQGAFTGNCSAGTSCVIPLNGHTIAIGNPYIIVAYPNNTSTGQYITGIGGVDSNFVAGATYSTFDTAAGTLSMGYSTGASSAISSSITLALNASSTIGWGAVIIPFTSNSGGVTLDSSGVKDDSTAATTHTAPSMTITGTSDAIVQGINTSSSAVTTISADFTQVYSPYVTSSRFTSVAYAVNATSYPTPTCSTVACWTTASTKAALGVIALK